MIEAYKIGITIALTNQVSSVLGAIGRDFTRTNAQAKALHATLKDIKFLGVAGGGLAAIGFGIFEGLKPAYEAAKKYEAAFTGLKQFQLGDAINADADKFARGSRLIGVSATDMMTTLTDLHNTFGHYDQAKMLTPMLAQLTFANKALYGERFGETQAIDMARVIERRGGFASPEAFRAQADMLQNVQAGTGMRVRSTDYVNMMNTGNVAVLLKNMSDKAFYYENEPLIQELKSGGRVGTGYMTAYRRVNGITQMSQADLHDVQAAGFIQKGGIEFLPGMGKRGRLKPGALTGGDPFADPLKWVTETAVPLFEKMHATSAQQAKIFAELFGSTGGLIFTTILQQRDKIVKNMNVSAGSAGIDATVRNAMNTPGGAEAALGTAFENLKIEMGRAILPVILPAMLKLADGFNYLAGVAERHPNIARFLGDGAIAIGVLASVTGGFLLLTAAMKAVRLLMGATGLPMIFRALGASIAGSGASAGIGGLLTGLLPMLGAVAAVMAVVGGLMYAFDPDFKKFVDTKVSTWWNSLSTDTKRELTKTRDTVIQLTTDAGELWKKIGPSVKGVGAAMLEISAKALLGVVDLGIVLADPKTWNKVGAAIMKGIDAAEVFVAKMWTDVMADWQNLKTAVANLPKQILDYVTGFLPSIGTPGVDASKPAPGEQAPAYNSPTAYHPRGGQDERPVILVVDDRVWGRQVLGTVEHAAMRARPSSGNFDSYLGTPSVSSKTAPA